MLERATARLAALLIERLAGASPRADALLLAEAVVRLAISLRGAAGGPGT